jgi:glutaredoxin
MTMHQDLQCQVYYDSSRGAAPTVPGAFAIDVAAEPAAAGRLGRLGLSATDDLPVALVTEPGGKLRLLGGRLSAEDLARVAAGRGLAAAPRPRMLATGWCGDCARAKRVLGEAGVSYDEVDVDGNAQLARELIEKSGGRRVVPTLVFDDRLWAFNPAPPLLRRLISRAES